MIFVAGRLEMRHWREDRHQRLYGPQNECRGQTASHGVPSPLIVTPWNSGKRPSAFLKWEGQI